MRRMMATGSLAAMALAGTMMVGGAAQAQPGSVPADAGASSATCSGRGLYGPARTNWTMSAKARATARAVIDDAKTCDKAALVWRSTRDRTQLSFGDVSPSQAWSTPDVSYRWANYHRYADTVKVLRARPRTFTSHGVRYTVWPRVAYDNTSGAWAEAVEAKVLTAAEARTMRRIMGSYSGYRVYITDGGRLDAALAGD